MPGTPVTPPTLLTYPEVCQSLKISRSTAERLARRGLLTKIHFGTAVRFDAEHVAALVTVSSDDWPQVDRSPDA